MDAVEPIHHGRSIYGRILCPLNWTLFAISVLITAGRVLSRFLGVKRFGADDALMLCAIVCDLVFVTCVQAAVDWGLGLSMRTLPISHLAMILKFNFTAQAFCLMALTTGRVSFILYLLSIIGKARLWLKYVLVFFMVTQVLGNFSLIFSLYGVCGLTLSRFANPKTTCFQPGHLHNYMETVAGWNIVTDGVLTIVPALLISRLQTTKRAKFAATAVLSLSFMAMAASIWRKTEIATMFHPKKDITYDGLAFLVSCSMEVHLIFIGTGIPTLGPLVRRLNWRKPPISSDLETHDSSDIQQNLSRALGMHFPTVRYSVTIEANAPGHDSHEDIMPTELAAIKTTRRTDVRSEPHPDVERWQ
ncbi:hypothetical protein K470DRAFT_256606 [Piedraia hortae CBS 480.64]|uniref:Rhodopsin domain-containing protein n=1 Tax=Piedraia hortae CBS 480.64 TaxID=1314780 RepID=A0A6A7C2F4_9PEZI|nr:hypothetical protein K470DRAFT_256606 [Piedraia hortae CBS 480.64]